MGRRRKKKNRIPAELIREVNERAEGSCEIMNPESGCTGRHEETHHRKLRSQGGGHSLENCVAVCSNCHLWLHRNTGIAYEHGWLVKSMKDPAYIPFERRGVMSLLDSGGGWHPVDYEPLSI